MIFERKRGKRSSFSSLKSHQFETMKFSTCFHQILLLPKQYILFHLQISRESWVDAQDGGVSTLAFYLFGEGDPLCHDFDHELSHITKTANTEDFLVIGINMEQLC